MSDKTTERSLYSTASSDNSNDGNYKDDKKKNIDSNHYCPKCNSHSLSFLGLDTAEGKRIQLIDCNDCKFEWQETWSLPNWYWLKSSSPDSYWTSER